MSDVRLRVLTVADADALDVEDTAELNEFNWFVAHRPGRLRLRIEAGEDLTETSGSLAISQPNGALIGDISWRQVPSSPAPGSFAWEIGIFLLLAARGKGYGAAAQRLIATYLFDTTLVNRVQATTDITNIAEQRALEKAGYTREGILRGFQYRSGGWNDIVMYSRLRGEE